MCETYVRAAARRLAASHLDHWPMAIRKPGFVVAVCVLAAMPLISQSSGTAQSGSTPSIPLPQIGEAVAGTTPPQAIELAGQVVHDSSSSAQPVVTDPILLKINADGSTEMKLSASTGTISEIRAATGVTGQCTSSVDKAIPAITAPNCWSAASWILPTFALANTTVVDKLAGALSTAMDNGRSVLQLKLFIPGTGHSASIGQYIETVSARTIALDPTTLLPISLTYSEHPGYKTYISIPAEVMYSDYRSVNGVVVPFRITKTLGRHIIFDITISRVTITP